MRLADDEADEHRAGDDGERHEREPPVEREQHADAITRRITEIDGETIAICRRPVVVSTSPESRDRMPPVFMSHSFGSGRCSSRSNSARRSDSITRMFRSRCR